MGRKIFEWKCNSFLQLFSFSFFFFRQKIISRSFINCCLECSINLIDSLIVAFIIEVLYTVHEMNLSKKVEPNWKYSSTTWLWQSHGSYIRRVFLSVSRRDDHIRRLHRLQSRWMDTLSLNRQRSNDRDFLKISECLSEYSRENSRDYSIK